MTDRELMQQALDALTWYDGTNGTSKRERILTALRERLAQQYDYRTRYDRGCYKCGSHYCPANCPEPTHLVSKQPQMQPCAGRNCGSTDPNLHSAECFEDYEKATGMNQKPDAPDWNSYKQGWEDGVIAEREACAKLCEQIDAEYEGDEVLATWCADAIRERGER